MATILERHPTHSRRSNDWLYAHHFGLREAPFSLTPDTRFFYAHPASRAALNTLLVAIRSGEGFIKVTGEVGTGKTLLCRTLLRALDEEHITTYIPNPYLEPMTLLKAIADELGLSYPDNVAQHRLLKTLTAFLIRNYAQRKNAVIVCLDEAHAMPIETLEALRLLSNLETERRKLLQLVLFGQPELDRQLAHGAIRQLRQRISFSCRLTPLDQQGVAQYLHHRLAIAAYQGTLLFNPPAVRSLYRASRGIPRLINILAHKSLIAAFGCGHHQVTQHHVRRAVADTESVAGGNGNEGGMLSFVTGAMDAFTLGAGGLFRGNS
ncbi:MAG: ExeA family protein [Gammaproteobacteria bacterium]